MESLSLQTLVSSLPTEKQYAEKELANNFKAAALSITNLYRSSRKTSKRAYNAGYAAACQDLLTMIQQGVSLNQEQAVSDYDAEGSGMTIGRVMDWIEARLEAVKSREEEEDEEEEKDGGRAAAHTSGLPPTSAVPVTATTIKSPTQSAGVLKDRQPRLPLSSSSSPSQPIIASAPLPLRPVHHQQRAAARPRFQKGDSHSTLSQAIIPDIVVPPSVPPTPLSPSDIPIPLVAGAKRRHAMMMMLDSVPLPSTGQPPSPTSANCLPPTNGSGRRRTRSSRNLGQHCQSQNLQTADTGMDVEEECGREKKRVTRR